jgi:2-iminoacetate synthase
MEFRELLDGHDFARDLALVEKTTTDDVAGVLSAESVCFDGYLRLLSPAADPLLEEIARRARSITLRRFGRTVRMYAPLYVSNVCEGGCSYCGFNAESGIERRTLSLEEVLREADALRHEGFRHVLVLSGEAPDAVPPSLLEEIVGRLLPQFASVSLEVYPVDEEAYGRFAARGADGVTIYQETYDRDAYGRLHRFGRKRDFDWRLETPERAARAGVRNVGIGALLGLSDFHRDAAAVGLHAAWLIRSFWKTSVAVSLPRISRGPDGFRVPRPVSDRELVRLLLAMRLFQNDVEIVLSTRESAALRDHLQPLGVTRMSAGSRTNPGGYAVDPHSAEQFPVEDHRTPARVAQAIRARGYEPVWKDWDRRLTPGSVPGQL